MSNGPSSGMSFKFIWIFIVITAARGPRNGRLYSNYTHLPPSLAILFGVEMNFIQLQSHLSSLNLNIISKKNVNKRQISWKNYCQLYDILRGILIFILSKNTVQE